MAGETVAALLGSLKHLVNAKMRDGASGAFYWDAADQAIAVLGNHSEELEGIGVDGVKDLLHLVGQGKDQAAQLAAIAGMDANAVIADMKTGTASVDAEVQKWRDRLVHMVAIAKELGEVGARIVLGLLPALV